MKHKITIENVADIFSAAGLSLAPLEVRGEQWHRRFIHLYEDGSRTPLSLGRVMFFRGKYSHIKWYSYPTQGDFTRRDKAYQDLRLYIATGTTMDEDEWAWFKSYASRVARHTNQSKQAERDKLTPKKRKRLMVRTPRWGATEAMKTIISERE